MQKRRRFKQSTSLQDRLASFAKQASEKASKLPPGPERENLRVRPKPPRVWRNGSPTAINMHPIPRLHPSRRGGVSHDAA